MVNPTVKVCGKNLLPFPYSNTSKTQNGVTFDVQNDGTIHIYGTASAVVYFNFSTNIEWGSASFSNTNEKYKLVGNLFYNASNKILSYVVHEGATCDSILKPMVVLKNETDLTYEPYHGQTATLPYTLNAIPVSKDGNVTINGQQYVADYVDVERGKVIRNILKWYPADVKTAFNNEGVWHINISKLGIDGSKISLSNMFKIQNSRYKDVTISGLYIANDGLATSLNMRGMTDEEFKKWLSEKNPEVYSVLTVAEEIPITLEEVSASKQLMTYYPVTNISANSEQLDGYTVFNYPVSMQNGWNYVKQQLNDNRDYIYDMDTKTQDIDTQAAEAYVNSEYAVALTELEV